MIPGAAWGMHGVPMESWLEVVQHGKRRRHALRPGLTRVGGPGCELEVSIHGADQLHVWDEPARLLFVGTGERPRIQGSTAEMWPLSAGDRIEWHDLVLTFDRKPSAARLEEIEPPAPAPVERDQGPQGRAWRRVRAGLLFEMGLTDRAAAKHWQESIQRGVFDPDACAADLVTAEPDGVVAERVLDRSGRLLRDLVMQPLLRGVDGAKRAVRGAARTGLAYLVTQVLVTLVFMALFLAVLLVVRLRWGWSVDGMLDGLLERLPGAGPEGG